MANALTDNRITRYLKEVRAELRKVTWPHRAEVVRMTGIVMVVLLVMSAFLGLLDFGFAQVMSLIVR
jgi:preprotein translocase subunit SecE